LLSAEEASSEQFDSAVTIDVTSAPVVHVVLVSDLILQHVESMSEFSSTSVVVISVGIFALEPAWGIGKWRVGARKYNLTGSFSVSCVKFFHRHLEVAILRTVVVKTGSRTIHTEPFFPSIGVSSKVCVCSSIVEVLVEEVFDVCVVLEEFNLKDTKLITTIGISSLVGTDSS
jgi:hypothetical protein